MNQALTYTLAQIKRRPVLLVAIPWLLYAFYLVVLASPKYESISQLVVKSSDGANSFDPSSMLMSSVTGVASTNDSQLVVAFVQSADMLHYLDDTIALREHYTAAGADFIGRLAKNHSEEDFLEYYLTNTDVVIDSNSSVIELSARAFDPAYAQLISQTIVKRAEQFINEISNNLAKSRLAFAQSEHDIVEEKLHKAKLALLDFQTKYNVMDPNAEGAAIQQIAFSLEATLAQKEAELNTLKSIMSDSAPEIISLKRQIKALEEQINSQKTRINDAQGGETKLSINQLMAQYSNLQVQAELAMQAYGSSLMTLENARVDTYQQIQHLVTIETPTLPDEAAYPKKLYNLVLFGVMLMMAFIAGRIIIATIKEL
ncbi:capsule biosynthesis protein [Alteromonas lipolytica]|uniref:Capsule biosynthesis protein n=1 Tax=Alteromonas lipolytica TaxID=1856405 RepID=A0A1E8F9K4_9ALTE|nr:capsule biosynthesis protein [Alteromonas lipolytica]OFI32590.1 capsule biosynthesis protein [Alteromonas lipolytica]GGF74861.1 capsule polysaccharide export inner-membrane protein CtrB [Alteromonas lipolytica]